MTFKDNTTLISKKSVFQAESTSAEYRRETKYESVLFNDESTNKETSKINCFKTGMLLT